MMPTIDGRALYHYTCGHARERIGDTGRLLSAAELVDDWRELAALPTSALVWLTDLTTPIRDALGLSSNLTPCDRTAFRYRVLDTSTVVPWLYVRRDFPLAIVEGLEAAPGARPAHWYVSRLPVDVTYDPRVTL